MAVASTLDQQNQIPIGLVEGANPGVGAQALGSVIRLTTTDDNIAAVVAAGYERLVVERSTDGGITFAEITVPSERPVLKADQPVMEFFDRRGNLTFFYRFRYIGKIAGQTALTDPSVAIEGAGLALLGILTVEQLKARYFFGVDITDNDGKPLADAVFQHYILSAIKWFETELDIAILPTAFSEFHDYYRNDYEAFNIIQLDNYPIICIDEFRVQYPSGQSVIVFPNEWLRIDPAGGTVQIVPTAGTLSEVLIGQGGSFLPTIYNGLDYLPQLFNLVTVAGFESGKVPRNIIDLIGMAASFGPFNLFGDLIAGAGIANVSLSMDGLSQTIGTTSSATNSGYGARLIQYGKQIKDQIPVLKRYYHGLRMIVA
ncbi:MAG: hypothetical protein O7G84_01225 [Gammaproteobacteria bacterium]|nr:hypothetical protein [Gammaproteobacteria bacterium]